MPLLFVCMGFRCTCVRVGVGLDWIVGMHGHFMELERELIAVGSG